jgi:hypothetical protein
VVRETEDAGRLDLLGGSCLTLTRVGHGHGPGLSPPARAVRHGLAAAETPSEPEAVAAIVALRTVAADLMMFAGVHRRAGGGRRAPTPARVPGNWTDLYPPRRQPLSPVVPHLLQFVGRGSRSAATRRPGLTQTAAALLVVDAVERARRGRR